MSEVGTVPSLMKMTSIVSEELLASDRGTHRNTYRDTDTEIQTHTHTHTHRQTRVDYVNICSDFASKKVTHIP